MADKSIIPSSKAQNALRKVRKNYKNATKAYKNKHEKFFSNRASKLLKVRRFVFAWAAIMLAAISLQIWQTGQLGNYYLADKPDKGGTYVEGVVGEIGSLNPIFADGDGAIAATKLIFSGLTKFNGSGEIELDLAESYSANDDLTEYTFKIRDDALWHDGAPVRAADVVFTVQAIQNPTSRSQHASNWQGIEAVEKNEKTVIFKLPSPFAPFLSLLRVGLLPEHVLGQAGAAALRIHEFNQNPVGSGPFKFDRLLPAAEEVQLVSNSNYYQNPPHLNRIIIKGYKSYDDLLRAYRARAISAVGGFDATIEGDFAKASSNRVESWPLASQSFAFYNLRRAPFKDATVRRALTQSIDLHELVLILGGRVSMSRSPLLPSQLGYDGNILQPKYNIDTATKLLEDKGWKLAQDGVRKKGKNALRFTITVQDLGVFPTVAQTLQRHWQAIGAEVTVNIVSEAEFEREYLLPRNFDVVAFTLAMGVDPDSYSFWHSSQADSQGLNISGYKSVAADTALADGRTRSDKDVRSAKYNSFLSAWTQDLPAAALFQPNYFYATSNVKNLEIEQLAAPEARFYNAHNWAAKFKPGLKRLVE